MRVRRIFPALVPALVVALATGEPDRPRLRVEGRSLRFEATMHPLRWGWHPMRYGGHHALVFEGGGMAGKALIRAPIPDAEVAEALERLGLEARGGIPKRAWEARSDAGDPAPDTRAAGDPVTVSVRWEGSGGWRPLGSLIRDRRGHGIDLRFADNREWIPVFGSGCIVCLSSCPGSKIANRELTIRENEAGAMDFQVVAEDLPGEGSRVEVRIDAPGGPDEAPGEGR